VIPRLLDEKSTIELVFATSIPSPIAGSVCRFSDSNRSSFGCSVQTLASIPMPSWSERRFDRGSGVPVTQVAASTELQELIRDTSRHSCDIEELTCNETRQNGPCFLRVNLRVENLRSL
jgi:hypothetical protein